MVYSMERAMIRPTGCSGIRVIRNPASGSALRQLYALLSVIDCLLAPT